MTEREGAEPREPTFGEAMEELEAILRRIEGEEVDVDGLAEELRRAAHLLELARGKLRRAEVEVTQVVQGIADEGADAGRTGDVEPEGEEADEEADEDEDDIPF